MLGGLAAGFLGAGLLGMLFGGGLFSGLGGLSSIIGLVLQIGLIYLVVRLAMSWWKRRNAPAYANASAAPGPAPMQDQQAPMANARSGFGFGLGGGSNDAPLEIKPDDYDAFERLLGEVQTAWSNEDIGKLHTLATPEMVSYFTEDLTANKNRGVVNKVSDVKLLQGDLAEAWREGTTDYATVALRYGLIDKTIERATGQDRRGQRCSAGGHRRLDVRATPRQPVGTVGHSDDLICLLDQISRRRRACAAPFSFGCLRCAVLPNIRARGVNIAA